jgi:hypothetical protein
MNFLPLYNYVIVYRHKFVFPGSAKVGFVAGSLESRQTELYTNLKKFNLIHYQFGHETQLRDTAVCAVSPCVCGR